eukprot:TRINITY_DN55311_c0_g1_i1.p1 TRINITY_DN55311_c0_g1~~TRINITY_DN55311_c0_g1_i1.p1  ORF type:complete len:397 (-),score=2.34 TRINITY_DN55311_c0_g1_i1:54-1244(-)
MACPFLQLPLDCIDVMLEFHGTKNNPFAQLCSLCWHHFRLRHVNCYDPTLSNLAHFMTHHTRTLVLTVRPPSDLSQELSASEFASFWDDLDLQRSEIHSRMPLQAPQFPVGSPMRSFLNQHFERVVIGSHDEHSGGVADLGDRVATPVARGRNFELSGPPSTLPLAHAFSPQLLRQGLLQNGICTLQKLDLTVYVTNWSNLEEYLRVCLHHTGAALRELALTFLPQKGPTTGEEPVLVEVPAGEVAVEPNLQLTMFHLCIPKCRGITDAKHDTLACFLPFLRAQLKAPNIHSVELALCTFVVTKALLEFLWAHQPLLSCKIRTKLPVENMQAIVDQLRAWQPIALVAKFGQFKADFLLGAHQRHVELASKSMLLYGDRGICLTVSEATPIGKPAVE